MRMSDKNQNGRCLGIYDSSRADARAAGTGGEHAKATAHGPAWEDMCEKDCARAGKGGGAYKGDGIGGRATCAALSPGRRF
jgi:hypothetical protein